MIFTLAWCIVDVTFILWLSYNTVFPSGFQTGKSKFAPCDIDHKALEYRKALSIASSHRYRHTILYRMRCSVKYVRTK